MEPMQETVVVTGGRGFVGRATVHAFRQAGYRVYTLGPSRPEDDPKSHLAVALEESTEKLAEHLRALRPVAILHLAAASPDALPEIQQQVTVLFTERLLDVVKKEIPETHFIYLGSAAEYGESLFLNRLLVETDACSPFSSYGQAKHAATLHVLEARRQGLGATVARLFNTVGPGLPRHGVLGNLALQLNQMGAEENIIHLGNLETYRDFMDVRDVSQRLLELFQRRKTDLPPLIHLCSGEAQKIGDWVEALIEASGKKVSIRTDPNLLRKKDPVRVVGSTELMKAFGLLPKLPDRPKLVHEILGKAALK